MSNTKLANSTALYKIWEDRIIRDGMNLLVQTSNPVWVFAANETAAITAYCKKAGGIRHRVRVSQCM